MPGAGRTLRVTILGVKVQEPRRYHINIQVLVPGQPPAGVLGLGDENHRPDLMARTETSAVSRSPEFLNRCFVLRLPTPLGSNATATASLQCNLFAMPSVEGQAGLMVAGKEIDELMGSSTLQIGGNVSERLLRGEHVTLPVVLGGTDPFDGPPGAANLDLMSNLGVGAGTNANMYGRTGRELLLELMLLDAELTLPRDVYAMKAAVAANVASAASPLTNAKLMVLVSRAENLPTVRGEGGVDGPPSTFVALSSQKDASSRSPPQAVTRVVENSHNPMWGQMLQVKYSEGELSNEKLYISITNDLNSRLMLKCCVPLGHVVPRVHYNLQLMIPGGALGGSVVLYVTLCLTDCPAMEMRRVRNLTKGGGVTDVYAARLAASSAPLAQVARLANGSDVDDDSGEVFALWRVGPAIVNSQHGWQPQGNPPGHGSPHAGRPGGSPEAPRPPFGSTFALPGDGHSHIGAQIGGAHFPGGTPNMGASGALPSITSGQPFPSPPGSRSGSALGGAHSSALPPLSSALGGAHSSALPPLNSALGGAHSSALPPLSSALGGAQGSALPPHGSAVPPHGSALPSPLKHVKHGNKHVARKEAPSNAQDPPSARPSAGAAMYGALGESVERGGGMFPLESTSSHSIPIGADPGMVARTGSRGPGALAEGTESHSRPYSPRSARYHTLPKSGPGPIAEASESGKKSPSAPASGQVTPSGVSVNLQPGSAANSNPGTPSRSSHQGPSTPSTQNPQGGQSTPDGLHNSVFGNPMDLASPMGSQTAGQQGSHQEPAGHYKPELGGHPPHGGKHMTSGGTPQHHLGPSPLSHGAGPLKLVQMPMPVDVSRLYTNVDAGSEDACNRAIMELSEEVATSKPGAVLDVMPVSILSGGRDHWPWPVDHTALLCCSASTSMSVKVELHHIAPGSETSVPIGYCELPTHALNPHGGVSGMYNQIPLCMGPQTNGTTVDMEVQAWDVPSYETHVARQAPTDARSLDAPDSGPATNGDTAMLSGMAWQGGAGGDDTPEMKKAAIIVETLVDDMVLKQLALERQVRSGDTNEARCEMAVWRLQDAENRVRAIQEDNNNLRNLVHEEKEATRAPQILENSANLSRDELVDRTEAALAAYARERRRNGELVHRLQQMHEEQVDMLELKRRYQELQAAHMSQGKFMNDANHKNAKLEAYRTTLKTQEEVISNLEQLLVQAVANAKNVAPAAPAAAEVQYMGLSGNEALEMMAEQKEEALQENFELGMKLKMEEERSRSAKNEVIDSVRRYAKEIADLKFKLAEKDAQLMGGFGDLGRLNDMDDDLGIPMVVIPPSPPVGGDPPLHNRHKGSPQHSVRSASTDRSSRPPRTNSSESSSYFSRSGSSRSGTTPSSQATGSSRTGTGSSYTGTQDSRSSGGSSRTQTTESQSTDRSNIPSSRSSPPARRRH